MVLCCFNADAGKNCSRGSTEAPCEIVQQDEVTDRRKVDAGARPGEQSLRFVGIREEAATNRPEN